MNHVHELVRGFLMWVRGREPERPSSNIRNHDVVVASHALANAAARVASATAEIERGPHPLEELMARLTGEPRRPER